MDDIRKSGMLNQWHDKLWWQIFLKNKGDCTKLKKLNQYVRLNIDKLANIYFDFILSNLISILIFNIEILWFKISNSNIKLRAEIQVV